MNKPLWTIDAITDTGLQRADNQDNYYISPDKRVFVVADGMGGAAHGALASRLAVESMQKSWRAVTPNYADLEGVKEWLQAEVSQANQAVMKLKVPGNLHNPGTTLIAAVLCDDGVVSIAHVGDSRAYLSRKEIVTGLTKDHSFVSEMLHNNQLTEEQAWKSPYRNLLTRCLGHDADVKIDHNRIELEAGDWVILGSDGLSGVLSNEEIARVLQRCESTRDACDELVKSVMDKDAPDNVTIIALHLESKSAGSQSQKQAAANGIH